MRGRRVEYTQRSGHAVIELSLIAPWILFLFMGIIDLGFYGYALISTENAARTAALGTSADNATAADSSLACQYALAELRPMANAQSLSTCASLPVIVSAAAATGADGAPVSRVSVTYRTTGLFPIPGLMGQLTVTRTAEMRIKD